MVAGEEACGQQPVSQVVEEDQLEAHFISPLVPTGPVSSVIFFLKWLPPSLELVLAGLASCAALAARAVAVLEDTHPSMEPEACPHWLSLSA